MGTRRTATEDARKKIFLCWTLNSGTSFYRMFNYVKYMEKEISFAFSKWSPKFQGIADWEYNMGDPNVQKDVGFLLDHCDMVIAQKFHWYGGLATLEACRKQYPKKPFYTELDDNVFAVNPESPACESYHVGSEGEKIVKEQIANSTGLIVSTDYLRRTLEEMNPNVWVIPNGIDFETWDSLKPKVKKSKKIRIGWAGGGAHVKDLEFIEPAVTAITKKYKNVEFVFLGGVPPCFKDKKKIKAYYTWHPINDYPQAIKDLNLDIALAPLRDNSFNRGKSNLRWLEYSALGVPTVASNVEPFKCIEDGKTGLLAVEPEEWIHCLERLIDDEGLRMEIGKNAYNEVKDKFNVEKIAKDYVKNIKYMLQGKGNISAEAKLMAIMSQNGKANGRVQA